MRAATYTDKEHVVSAIKWGHKHGLTFNGFYYHDELAGPHGARYQIFVPPNTSREDETAAIEQMYADCDVVGFEVIYVPQEWIDEATGALPPTAGIMQKVLDIADGKLYDHTLVWPDRRSLHLDPTTTHMLAKVYRAVKPEAQLSISQNVEKSPEKFMAFVDRAWQCIK